MPLRLAVLGAGRIGQVHANAIAGTDGAQLVAVADAMPEVADSLAARHGGQVRSVEAVESSDDIDAVVVCTPTDMHADLIERFARAGKAIFCEKPIDLDVARVRDCLGVVEQTGATLMVGFQRRFDPDFMALKAAIDDGRIGTVETVALTSRDPAPPPVSYIERSGGIFRDMAIHDFDVARWLLGEPVETVQAVGSVLVDPAIGAAGDFDTVTVLLRTASGKQCTIACSRRASYGYDQRIEVHGSAGCISAQNTHRARIEIGSEAGFVRPPLEDFFMSRYRDAYAAEIAAFVAAVRDGSPVRTSGDDGLQALLLAEAAARSVNEMRIVSVQELA